MPMYLVGDIDSSYDCSSYFYMDNHNRQQRINDWNVIPTGGLSRHYDGVERGVVFFLRNSQVVGICLWNVKNENAYSIARSVVRDAGKS